MYFSFTMASSCHSLKICFTVLLHRLSHFQNTVCFFFFLRIMLYMKYYSCIYTGERTDILVSPLINFMYPFFICLDHKASIFIMVFHLTQLESFSSQFLSSFLYLVQTQNCLKKIMTQSLKRAGPKPFLTLKAYPYILQSFIVDYGIKSSGIYTSMCICHVGVKQYFTFAAWKSSSMLSMEMFTRFVKGSQESGIPDSQKGTCT